MCQFFTYSGRHVGPTIGNASYADPFGDTNEGQNQNNNLYANLGLEGVLFLQLAYVV